MLCSGQFRLPFSLTCERTLSTLDNAMFPYKMTICKKEGEKNNVLPIYKNDCFKVQLFSCQSSLTHSLPCF